MAIKIVVDSTSDIPVEFIEKNGIEVVPLTVNFENESFLDKVEITSEEFFDKLSKADKLPTTSQASPGAFVEVFERILNNGDEILGIFISSGFSGTCESARIAKDIIGTDKIHIIDSQTACVGSCLLALEACKLIKDGYSIDKIVENLEEIKEKIVIYAGVDTLKYLEKGGRLSKGVATVGTLLNIKPILRVKCSKFDAVEKIRGKNKVVKWLDDWISENVDAKNSTIAIYHSLCPELAENLSEILKTKHNVKETFIGEIGSVIGTHVGPNALAIGYIED